MNDASGPTALTSAELLAGPRGRRLILEYALASELSRDPDRSDLTFGYAAMHAGRELSHHPHRSAPARRSALDAADRLALADIAEPTPELLRAALAAASGNARYWDTPDGLDMLASLPEMQRGMHHTAERVLASPLTAWWRDPAPLDAQFSVQWAQNGVEGQSLQPSGDATFDVARWTDAWASRPEQTTYPSTRPLSDDAPAGLWFVEDSNGWERARSAKLALPGDASVFEIRRAEDWAGLCARFPRDVTEQKQDDWRRATAYEGSWTLPDWTSVAEHYDGVHLQVSAYLGAAGTPIFIDEQRATASMIAGWNPDETHWFIDVEPAGDYTYWALVDDGSDMVWSRP